MASWSWIGISVMTLSILVLSTGVDAVPRIRFHGSTGETPEGHFSVEESSFNSFVAAMLVEDDDGSLEDIQCSVNNDLFPLTHVGPGKGDHKDTIVFILMTKSGLDREAVPEYDVEIECRNTGVQPPTSTVKRVHISVKDRNDNRPIFPVRKYEFTLVENNSPGVIVGKVEAHDPDVGINGEISYTLEDDVRLFFTLEEKTGIIRAARSISMLYPIHMFRIKAENKNARLKLRTTAYITVNVVSADEA